MPRFSVVVPTRNRPGHLLSCLASIDAQTFGDYECVVQDNSDSPAWLAEGMPKTRTRQFDYQFNRRVLAMAANWDKAVARATGEYVLVVGDDDALYPTCLESADRLIRAGDLDALRWGQSIFRWPHESNLGKGLADFPGERGYQDHLDLPLVVAHEVMAGRVYYGMLPTVYTGCVRRELLGEVRVRCGGRLFPTRFPDLWSGMAVCALAKRVGFLHACLAVSGSSADSTGARLFSPEEGDPVREEFRRLNDEAGLRWHGGVPAGELNPLAAMLTDSYLWVRDLIGWPAGFPEFREAKLAEVPKGWLVPADYLQCKTAADAARFAHEFTRGVPPEVVIEELRREARNREWAA